MNMKFLSKDMQDFKERIIQTLKLEIDQADLIAATKRICSWASEFQTKITFQREEQKKNETFFGNILSRGKKKSLTTLGLTGDGEKEFQIFRAHIANRLIPRQFVFTCPVLPKEIEEDIQKVKGKQWKSFYGFVRSPLISNMYIRKKQDFHYIVEQVYRNGLKFIMIQEAVAHKYQRNLVQEIFSNVFRQEGSLSMVLKIEVQGEELDSSYDLYCYIENVRFKEGIVWRGLDAITEEFNELYVIQKSEKMPISDVNILELLLAEVFVLPVQTLVSNYIVSLSGESVKIRKYSEQHQKDIMEQSSLKQHPSLRNPLPFFRHYIHEHSLSIKEIQKYIVSRELISHFYHALNIITQLMLLDFSLETNNQLGIKRQVFSLCFNASIFEKLWDGFHRILLISGWLRQVIGSLKDRVTFAEILAHFCPIFNESTFNDIESIKQYQEFMNHIDIESLLTTSVNKKTLEKYKNMYVNIEESYVQKQFLKPSEIYKDIFSQIIEDVRLSYCDVVECCYILHFAGKNKFEGLPCIDDIDEQWRDISIWKKCIKRMKDEKLVFIDLDFDIFAYSIGIDTFSFDPDAFERVQFSVEGKREKERLKEFVYLIRKKYSKKSSQLLSILLQQTFKHKKYDFCTILLQTNCRIQNFIRVLEHEELLLESDNMKKQILLNDMKNRSPRMHRLYQWQKMIIGLRQAEQTMDSVRVTTLEYGELNLPLGEKLEGELVNNLSRKDYMFDPNRQILRIDLHEKSSFYIQKSSYPLLPHFYWILFKKLDLQDLMPYFTSFFYNNQLYHLIEHLNDGTNWNKMLGNYNQNQVFDLSNPSLISEAIILSIALFPGKIGLKDMIICPSKAIADKIFFVCWNYFYRMSSFTKEGSNIILTTKNSLFILDMMHKVIPENLIRKYSQLDIIELIEDCFESLSSLVEKMNKIKEKESDAIPNKQLLGFIFEKGFVFSFAERLSKIKRLLLRKDLIKGITYMKLLQVCNIETALFYEQIITSDGSLLKREENLMDQMYKKSFINSTNLVTFFGSFTKIDEPQNKFPSHYHRFCFDGPSESLACLLKNHKKLRAFDAVLPSNLTCFSNDGFQYFIKEVDSSLFKEEQRKKLFEIIREKSMQYIKQEGKRVYPLNVVSFKNIEIQKDKLLNNFSYERTQELYLQNCKISDTQMATFSRSIDNVTYVSLKNIKGLKTIGDYSVFENQIEIKHLKTLVISDCDQLSSIQLKCDILENVQLYNNRSLKNIYFSSVISSLKNIHCTKNPQLNLENLAIYVLKGINVCVCKVSCHGDFMKLYDKDYQLYLAKVVKYLYHRFEDQGVKANIVLTLGKLNEIDQNMSKLVQFSSGITEITKYIGKYGTEIEDSIILQLFKLYLANPHVHTLYCNSLTSGNTARTQKIFKLFYSALEQRKNVRSIRQINIQHPLRQNIEQFMNICNLLRHEKHLTLTISSFEGNLVFEQKVINFFSMTKGDIEKITLNLQNDTISKNLLHEILNKEEEQKKIVKLMFDGCKIQTQKDLKIPQIKELKIKGCEIETWEILGLFKNVANLTLANNEGLKKQSLIGFLKNAINLEVLNLSHQKEIIKDFDHFCEFLLTLPKLKVLYLSQIQLLPHHIKILSETINKTSIKQISLIDFYKVSQNPQFSKFLQGSTQLSSLTIEFPKEKHLAEFIMSLSKNKSLTTLSIKTNYQIASPVLTPLNKNNNLTSISSDWPIPMWLRNQIYSNKKQKSKIYDVEPEVMTGNSSKVGDYWNIGLSLDGGGVRGLLLATQLEYIERMVGQPIHKIFDCIGGTSIGGILALSAASTQDKYHPVCSGVQMMELFEKYGNSIFKKTQGMGIKSLFDTKYSPSSFEGLLKNYFRDCKLSDVLDETNVIVTAVNRLDNKDVIFRSMEAILNRQKDFYMRDVARATSAAPTYFPSAEIKNITATAKFSLIDGGIGMNNPSKLVIDEIKKISANLGHEDNFFLLSLGTGRLKSEAIPEFAGIKDLGPIIDSFTESANYFTERDLQENYKGHFLRVSPTINLSKKQGELDNTDANILRVYKDTGYEAAKKYFSNTVIFGKYRNMNLIQWLQENTARKQDY